MDISFVIWELGVVVSTALPAYTGGKANLQSAKENGTLHREHLV